MAKQIKTQLVIEGKNSASKAFKQADSQLSGNQLGQAKKAGALWLPHFQSRQYLVLGENSITAVTKGPKNGAVLSG